MQTHSIFLAAVSAAVVLPCLFLTGCHSRETLDAAATAHLPVSPIVALVGKQASDTGQKLVRQPSEDPPALAAGSSSPASPEPLTRWTPVEKIALTGGGKGLIVCDPVPVNTSAGLTDFGTGCSRWLDLSVAGLPQLGQTPQWASLWRAQTEMNRTDLRLTPPEARRLGGITGVTHAATGQITGTAALCTLTYQLYALPQGTAVGPPLRVTGTQAQVLSQLPALAGRLAALLGVTPAPALPAISATPAQIGLLGHLPLSSDSLLPAAQMQQLQALAARLPLAGMFLVNTNSDIPAKQWSAVVKTLLTQEPSNGLIWAQLGSNDPALLLPAQAALAAACQKYPRNYLFASANVWVQRHLRHENAERRAAEMTVQDAPQNPDAWLTLGYTIADEGQTLRQGRVAATISGQEWQFLNISYAQWLTAVSQAARLDPLYAKAWNRVASAATFAGNPPLADKALWKGITLSPNDPTFYGWGLQMYQDKWDSNPAKLQQVAQALVTLSYPTVSEGLGAVKMLNENEQQPGQFAAQKQALLASLLARTGKAIAANPGDAQAHYDQAYALKLAGNPSDAIAEFKNVTVLRPNDPQSFLNLAQEYDDGHRSSLAVAAYRQALALDPASALAHCKLGWALKEQRQFASAEAELRQTVKLAPLYPDGHAGLGQVLIEENRKDAAIPEMRQALQLNPTLMPTLTEFPPLLDERGHYAESLAAAGRALTLLPGDAPTMTVMADDYLHLKQWNRSIQMSQQALDVNPNDAISHENLAEAYVGLGRKAEARAEWNKVLTMNDPAMQTVARQMLAKYP